MVKFIAMIFFIGISFGANSQELPDEFFSLKPIELPINRRTSFPSMQFPFGQDNLQKHQGGQSVLNLYQYLMMKKNGDILSMSNEEWSGYREANEKNTKGLSVARIPCIQPFDCFLVSPDSGDWIVVSRDKEVIDFQLSRALKYIYDDKKQVNKLVAQLDTFYGAVDWFPYPETDYEKTGIFCSILTTTLPSGEEKVQIFKRRITPEGKIENKESPEGVQECKLPW